MTDDSTSELQVSVLMPCYNVESTVDETLRSLRAQSMENFELVVVDDGSSDNTLAILEGWARRDGRIRVLACEHAGIIPALNTGWKACRGAYVARMDADDLCHPARLEKQARFLDQNPEIALVAARVEGFPEEDMREGFRVYIDWLNSLISPDEIAREIYIESPLAHPSVMMRREWLTKMGGYQEHGWPEDYDLWLRMHLAGAKMGKIPEVLLYWREHPARLTRTDSRYAVEAFLKAKAHYLCLGPLENRDAVVIWGSGQMGKRLSKHLLRDGAPVKAFIDIDPDKAGRTRRGKPIYSPGDLAGLLAGYQTPAVLAAVSSRGARQKIKEYLDEMGLREGEDWWGVA